MFKWYAIVESEFTYVRSIAAIIVNNNHAGRYSTTWAVWSERLFVPGARSKLRD